MARGIALSVLGTLLGIALAPGCANGGDASIIVLRSVAPSSTTDCTFSASNTELTVSSGELEARSGTPYRLALQLTTRVTAVAGMENQRLVFVTGALVDISFPDSTLFSATLLAQWKASALTHFKAQGAVLINANGGLSDTVFDVFPGDLSIEMIKAVPTFQQVNAIVTVKVIGGLGASGDDLSSDPFEFPVTITNGGLLSSKGLCSELASTFVPRSGSPCNPGQDGITDCCTNADQTLVCPAVGTKM